MCESVHVFVCISVCVCVRVCMCVRAHRETEQRGMGQRGCMNEPKARGRQTRGSETGRARGCESCSYVHAQ